MLILHLIALAPLAYVDWIYVALCAAHEMSRHASLFHLINSRIVLLNAVVLMYYLASVGRT